MFRNNFLATICLLISMLATACSGTSGSKDANSSTTHETLTPAVALQNKRVFDRIISTVHFRQPTDTGWASAEIGIHPLFSTFPH
jgi:hypothetical protein